MSVSSTVSTIEADGVSVLASLPSLSALFGEFNTLFQGVATGEGGLAKVNATAGNLVGLISGVVNLYTAFHAAQEAVKTPPPAN